LLLPTCSAVHVARFQLMTLVGGHPSERIATGIRAPHSRVASPGAVHNRRRAHAQHARPAAAHIREGTSALAQAILRALRSGPAEWAFRVASQPSAAKARGYVTRSCLELVIVCCRLQMSGCVTRLGRTISSSPISNSRHRPGHRNRYSRRSVTELATHERLNFSLGRS
jgi:hypothetical protein